MTRPQGRLDRDSWSAGCLPDDSHLGAQPAFHRAAVVRDRRFSVGTSRLFFGLWPALKAARLDPIAACATNRPSYHGVHARLTFACFLRGAL